MEKGAVGITIILIVIVLVGIVGYLIFSGSLSTGQKSSVKNRGEVCNPRTETCDTGYSCQLDRDRTYRCLKAA